MSIAIIQILLGFAALVWAADRFVAGAASIAANLRVPPIIIGLTLVAIGSSAPEIMVSLTASIEGTPGIAIGNAIGSNITNIALVLGICALIRPILVDSQLLHREFPMVLSVTILAGALLIDAQLSLFDAIIMLVGLVIILSLIIVSTLRARSDDRMIQEATDELPPVLPLPKALFWFCVGLALLPLSSDILVEGATTIAKAFNISDLVIGLTIIAIGTSLPELAASVAGVLKKEDELAVGNIIGSNIFNLMAVLPIPGLFGPTAIENETLTRDYPVMLVLTIALFMMAFSMKTTGKITRIEGGLLLSAFIGYLTWLTLSVL